MHAGQCGRDTSCCGRQPQEQCLRLQLLGDRWLWGCCRCSWSYLWGTLGTCRLCLHYGRGQRYSRLRSRAFARVLGVHPGVHATETRSNPRTHSGTFHAGTCAEEGYDIVVGKRMFNITFPVKGESVMTTFKRKPDLVV